MPGCVERGGHSGPKLGPAEPLACIFEQRGDAFGGQSYVILGLARGDLPGTALDALGWRRACAKPLEGKSLR